jgi:hypothetical protein
VEVLVQQMAAIASWVVLVENVGEGGFAMVAAAAFPRRNHHHIRRHIHLLWTHHETCNIHH